MENKYQEALDLIRCNNCRGNEKCGNRLEKEEYDLVMKSFDTLQELVDISSRPTIIYGDENTCVVNPEQIDKLEKALDKACGRLEKLAEFFSKEQWKELCLKDE